MTRAEKLLFLCAAPHRKGETLKIIFNDAAELQVQQVYTDTSGALRIKTISAAQEELKRMFSDQTKTKKMIVQERGQTLAVYDNYTQLDGIMAYTAGILEPVLYKTGDTPEERMQKLSEENAALLQQVDMLTQCILEMSERVYQ